MGAELVRRLLAAGCDVAVYNRTKAKAEPLAEAGAKIADTAAELAGRDIVFVTVGTSQDLIDALTGPAGVLSSGQPRRASWLTARRSRPTHRGRSERSWRRGAPCCSPRR